MTSLYLNDCIIAYLFDINAYWSNCSALFSVNVGIFALVVFGNSLVSRVVMLILLCLSLCQLLNNYLSLRIILSFNLLDQFLSVRSGRESSFTLFAIWRMVRSLFRCPHWWVSKFWTRSGRSSLRVFRGGTGQAWLFGNRTSISVKSRRW